MTNKFEHWVNRSPDVLPSKAKRGQRNAVAGAGQEALLAGHILECAVGIHAYRMQLANGDSVIGTLPGTFNGAGGKVPSKHNRVATKGIHGQINTPMNDQTNQSAFPRAARQHGIAAATAISALTVLMCSCGPTAVQSHETSNNDAKAVLASCPADRSLNSRTSLDMSGSRINHPLSNPEHEALRTVVRRTVICGGTTEVSAFFGSVASTAPLYSGKLHLDGATENARLRREPALTASVMATIETNLTKLQSAANAVTAGGTDILGQLGQTAEFEKQLDPTGSVSNLNVLLITDGEDNATLHLGTPTLSREQALAIADEVDVPDLSGANVTFIGVGKTSNGAIAETTYVDALKAAWTRVCERTGATQCIVVTDPASGQ
ncbi:hypothetical protein [Rhodococcus erythropolis]